MTFQLALPRRLVRMAVHQLVPVGDGLGQHSLVFGGVHSQHVVVFQDDVLQHP